MDLVCCTQHSWCDAK